MRRHLLASFALPLGACWTNAAAAPQSPSPPTDPPAAPSAPDPEPPALDPGFTPPTTAPPAESTTLEVRAPHRRWQLPFYLSARFGLGYGSFAHEKFDNQDTYHDDAGGLTAGGGVSIGWFLGDHLAIGATLDFDPLIAPSGRSGKTGDKFSAEPIAMPNGTIGAMLAWLPIDMVATELSATLGGGGVDGLPGGFGLIFHAAASVAVVNAGPISLGPVARVSVGPLMTDPVNGGSVTYWSFDLGVLVHAGAKRH